LSSDFLEPHPSYKLSPLSPIMPLFVLQILLLTSDR
jgi:hypothetical protein